MSEVNARPDWPAALSRDDTIAFANTLADRAREIARQYFRGTFEVESKSDDTPVTTADREIETMLRDLIRKTFPGHGIYGEEFGGEDMDKALAWILDPIDGTKSFISGVPLFGTLIALVSDGRPVLGVIEAPILGERWAATSARPTTLNGVVCRTSSCETLADAGLHTTTLDIFLPDDLGQFEKLSQAVSFRRFGGDCYIYGLLSSGHVDLILEADLQPYDYMALTPVIENAGGVITDWQGRGLDLSSDGRVLAAANPALHAQALAVLAGR